MTENELKALKQQVDKEWLLLNSELDTYTFRVKWVQRIGGWSLYVGVMMIGLVILACAFPIGIATTIGALVFGVGINIISSGMLQTIENVRQGTQEEKSDRKTVLMKYLEAAEKYDELRQLIKTTEEKNTVSTSTPEIEEKCRVLHAQAHLISIEARKLRARYRKVDLLEKPI